MPHPERDALVSELENCEQLASGRWWQLMYHSPVRFIRALAFRTFLKPFFKKGANGIVLTFFGTPMTVRLPAGADIYLTGCKSRPQEIRLTKWMLQYIKPRWVVMEAGTHFGFYTLLLQHLTGPLGKVIAFEPSPLNFKIISGNVAGMPTISLYQKGLSNITGRQLLAIRGLQNTQTDSFYYLSGASTILADVITLDDWTNLHVTIPRFIKVGAGGSVWPILQGAESLIFLYHPIIAMEIKTADFEECYYPAIEWLKANGYRMYSLSADGSPMFCTDAWTYLQSNSIVSDNFLFLPRKQAVN